MSVLDPRYRNQKSAHPTTTRPARSGGAIGSNPLRSGHDSDLTLILHQPRILMSGAPADADRLRDKEVEDVGFPGAGQGAAGQGAGRVRERVSLVTATSAITPAIRVQGVEKAYGKLAVLRGVDFDVAGGSIFALLGSNGAGKTTVVRILSTLLRADTGTVTVNGFDVATQAGQVRESISLTGQFAAVDEILTGRENLILVARLRHLKDPGTMADDLLARFSLTDAGGRKVSTYSGGMRRRLDIAMSLIGNPSIIVLDEPTTGLDPEARMDLWQHVRELAQRGTTVLLTTQHLDEAEALADRIAILHRERIIVNGSLDELQKLLPPAKVEYVEKQPSLEEIFLAVVGEEAHGNGGNDIRPHSGRK